MKRFYLWTLLLVISGVILALFLFPSDRDIALIEFKSQKYSSAKKYYKNEYAKGERSADIIIPLSKIEEKEGNIDKAIALIEEYVHNHPKDPQALELLGNLYRVNQQYDEYFSILLKLSKTDNNTKILQELSLYYEAANESQANRSVLEELVKREDATPSNYIDLAYLQAQKKCYKKAYDLLELGRKRFPKDVTISDMMFEVWVMIQISQKQNDSTLWQQQAARLLASYLKEENSVDLANYAISTVNVNYPYLTLSLIDQIQPIIIQHPILEGICLQILWEKNIDRDKVLQRLITLYSLDKTNQQIQNLLFYIFIEKNYELLLVDMIRNSDVKKVDERLITKLVILSYLESKPYIAIEIMCALGQDYLNSHPLIATELAIGAKDPMAFSRLNIAIENHTFTQIDLFLLLQLLAAIDVKPEALALQKMLLPYVGLDKSDLLQIASSFAKMKKAPELYQDIKNHLGDIGKEKAGPALSLLNIYLHRSKRTAHWIQREKNISESTLLTLYTAAEEEKQYPIALYIAKRQMRDYPSLLSKANYALALMQNGKVHKGLSCLQQYVSEHPDDTEMEKMYFSGLVIAAKASPSYYDTLSSFMESKEQKGQISIDMLRDFAYVYLDVLHQSDKAQQLFTELAIGASIESKDMQTLFYLWGPVVSEKRRRWIEKKASKASNQELGGWLKELVFIGDYDTVIALYERNPSTSVQAQFALMDAFVYKKEFGLVRKQIDQLFCKIFDVHDLEKLMYYAVSSEYIQAQEKIGKKIVSLSPSSATSWQRLAQTACQQGDYKLASHALRKFFALCKNHCKDYPDFYESLYDCALVLDKNHKHAKAEKFYHLALDQICKSKDITFAMREKQILILDKLGQKTQAFTKMNEFYDLSSRDPSVAAVSANMLMDHGDLNQARHLLEAVMAEEIAVYRSQCKGSFYPAEEKNCPLQERGPFDCNDAPIKHDKESFCTPSNTKEK